MACHLKKILLTSEMFSSLFFMLISGVTLQMLSSKDINFVGYTYKNFEIVNDYQVPGMSIYLPLSHPHTPA